MPVLAPSIVTALVVAQLAGATLQATPDFSGEWTLAGVSNASAETPQADTLSVREVAASTLPGPPPMPPGSRALVIEYRTGDAVRREHVPIGINGGIVGGVSGGGVPGVPISRSEHSSRWRDGHLVLWHHESVGQDGDLREVETTEDWSLDTAGRLVVSTWSRRTGAEPTRGVATYRRR